VLFRSTATISTAGTGTQPSSDCSEFGVTYWYTWTACGTGGVGQPPAVTKITSGNRGITIGEVWSLAPDDCCWTLTSKTTTSPAGYETLSLTAKQTDCSSCSGCGYVVELTECNGSNKQYWCLPNNFFFVGQHIELFGRCYVVSSFSGRCSNPVALSDLSEKMSCEYPPDDYCSPFCVGLTSGNAPIATITISGSTGHAGTTHCDVPCASIDGIYVVGPSARYIGDGTCTSNCSGVSNVLVPVRQNGFDCDCFAAFGVGTLTLSWCIEDVGGGNSTITVNLSFLPPSAGVGETAYQATVPNTCGGGSPITLTRTSSGACCTFPATITIDFTTALPVAWCGS